MRLEVVGLAFAFFALWSCTPEGTPCTPGDYIACDCPNAVNGLSQCVASGEGYGTCDCSGKVPGITVVAPNDASVADAASEGSALLPFMSPCEKDSDCDTGLCYLFNAKGPHCSRACTASGNECGPPSTGCNNMGICKVP